MADKEKVIIELDLKLDDGSFKRVTGEIVKDSKKAGKKAGAGFGGGFAASFLNTKTLVIGAIAAIGAAFSASKLIEAAAKQEDAINSLNSSLVATGKFSERASKDLQNFASSLQEVSRFGDEAILEVSALIQNLGNLNNQGLKGATDAALNLASALKIDVRTAANLVGRAAAGNVSLFSRYGLTIATGATKAETFANALRVINDRFKGAATRDVNTYSGAVEQLGNTFGDLQEDLGQIITGSNLVAGAIKSINNALLEIRNNIALTGTSADDAQSRIGILTDRLAKLKEERDLAAQDPAEDFLGLTTAFDVQISQLEQRIEKERELKAVQDERSEEQESKIAIGDQLAKEAEKVKLASDNIKKNFAELSKSSKDSLQKGMGQAAASGFSALGAALVSGEDAVGAFAKAMVSAIGQTLIQLGTNFILRGIAYSFDPLMGGPAVGGPLIAAGAAMATAGGAMTALGGGSAGVASGAATGGTPTGELSAGETQIGDLESQELQERGASININISGDVLDSDASGLRIVELINQATDTENVTIRRAAIA